jgi:hypothetical protein
MSLPLVNGVYVSYAQIRVQVQGISGQPVIDIFEIDSIDYSYKVDIREKWLTSPFPIARYSRRTESTGNIEMPLGTARAFFQYLTQSGVGGVTDVSFMINVVYQAEQGGPFALDVLHGVRCKGATQSNATGGKHLSTKIPLMVSYISMGNTLGVSPPTPNPTVNLPNATDLGTQPGLA